jgi:hypothetical protein
VIFQAEPVEPMPDVESPAPIESISDSEGDRPNATEERGAETEHCRADTGEAGSDELAFHFHEFCNGVLCH